MKSVVEKLKHFLEKHERPLSMCFLFGGFIFDTLTLTKIDTFYDNAVIIVYILISSIGIVVVNLYNNGRIVGKVFSFIDSIFPLLIQFAYGGLFSAFTIFYFRSATFSESWPFVIILAGLLIANEFLKKHYRIFTVQVSILYFVIYVYLIFITPIILQKMGTVIFILSGITSLLVIKYYRKLIAHLVPELHAKTKKTIFLIISTIFISMNVLYFFNLIPPIPLSMRSIGVYHSVVKTNSGKYVVRYEKTPWYKTLFFTDVYHKVGNEDVYVMSSVFAPINLKTDITHEWQRRDEKTGDWKTVFTISYPIKGNGKDGYKGYTLKTNPDEGLWRINVLTEKGQVIGREKFRIQNVSEKVEIEQKTI